MRTPLELVSLGIMICAILMMAFNLLYICGVNIVSFFIPEVPDPYDITFNFNFEILIDLILPLVSFFGVIYILLLPLKYVLSRKSYRRYRAELILIGYSLLMIVFALQILELYMAIGGIPHYLRQVEKGKSSTQIINSLCFHKDGFLFTEFTRLFQSLFDHADIHNKIICEIGKKRNGILRADLLEATGYKSGGTFKKRLQELRESGFIQEFIPYGKSRKDFTIKIVDEYTLFFLHWIKPLRERSGFRYNPNYWLNLSKEPGYLSWAGYAFEAVCMKHIDQILKKLEIENLASGIGSWRYIPPKKSRETGAQIDLLIDRIDNSINVCEIKFSNNKYSIDKTDARNLDNKVKIFEEKTGTKKQIFVTMITTLGLKRNFYSEELVDSEVILKDLIF